MSAIDPIATKFCAAAKCRDGPGAASRTAANSGRLCGAFDPHVDFDAERLEVDRLGQQCLGAVLQSMTLGFRIAIGRTAIVASGG